MIDTILFDLDGTLLYTLKDLQVAVNYALKKHNMPEQTLEEVQNNVGNGVEKLIERSIARSEIEKSIGILNAFKTYYSANMTVYTKPYDGIIEMLTKLKAQNYKIGVVSNKYDSAVKELCHYYFKRLIDFAIGQTSTSNKKPAPDTVYHAMKELNSKSAIFVGDSTVDIQTAKNANLDCISVSWGYRPIKELLKHNDKVINSPAELFQYV